MLDVVIAGAGPAGAIAALVMARAGARVLIVDRETFPRDKLCGDTLNPGALRVLDAVGLRATLPPGRQLDGMIVSGPRAIVRTPYLVERGVAITRRVLDAWLLQAAVAAGARFESGLVARRPLVDEGGASPRVRGLVFTRRGQGGPDYRIPAIMSLAADGRGSAIGRAVRLVSHPDRPRRWAFGAYATGIAGVSTFGEMHVRPGGYIGIAPLAADHVNVCVVTGAKPAGRSPGDVMARAIAANPRLKPRFETVAFTSPVAVLGPLAVNAAAPGMPGLLLAGDAAGFVDPMTGDGLTLAMRGGLLAARETMRALETGQFDAAVTRLAEARLQALGPKIRFNRAVRRLVESPVAVEAACWGSRVAPGLVRRAVRYAGDES
jgi:flavin-dependent dehydrogenase